MKWRLLFSSTVFFSWTAVAGTSVAPVAGYAPTYGVFGGAGYFLDAQPSKLEVFAVLSSSGSMQGQVGYKHTSFFDVDTKLDFKNGFENFYGFDGANTPQSDRMELTQVTIYAEALAPISRRMKIGWRLEWAQRWSSPLAPYYQQLHHLWTLEGVAAWKDWARVTVGTNFLTGNRTSLRATLDMQPEFEIAHKTQIAVRGKVGTTLGPYDPLTEFSLGGSDQLRGYLTQRFRGKHIYLFESALRFPIYWHFRGSLFGGVGDAFLEKGTGPKAAGGFGIQFALPPDEVQVVRLDTAVGQDQWGIYLDFGLPY